MAHIFVFGSNLAGRHGAGSALHARKMFGAAYGVGVGRTGDAYAIPTKNARLVRLAIDEIRSYVIDFIQYATAHPNDTFEVVKIGCGLAGYDDKQIAPLFHGAPLNCQLPPGWRT